jgi:predicted lipoprotein with Yx(FWY)xxD motif
VRTDLNEEREADTAAHLEGLRAWLREVDRVIRIRSRIGVGLIAIAIAVAALALFLGFGASRHSASNAEVQELQGQIEALRGQASRATTRLEAGVAVARSRVNSANAEIAKLRSQVQGLQKKAETAAVIDPKPSRGAPSTAGGEGSVAAAKGSGGSASGAGKSSSAEGASVSVASNPKLGKIIVDSAGLTLYDFHKDKGGHSACYGSCAGIWPPLLTKGTPQAGGGAAASQLGTTKRKDGTVQVTYAGHPLYTYVGDKEPGDTAGNAITEFGASWHALHQSGAEAPG